MGGRGRSHLQIEWERKTEMEGEFIDVELPICTSKSWHPGGLINLWWNLRITLMNVHTYHRHIARADKSFADVSVLRQTGSKACMGCDKWESKSEAYVSQEIACCTHVTPHLSCAREHLWSVWVTFLLSYKSPPAFSQWRQLCYSKSPCMLYTSLVSTLLGLHIKVKWKRDSTCKSLTGTGLLHK